jgi:predicted phage terminase large subunit-like protein
MVASVKKPKKAKSYSKADQEAAVYASRKELARRNLTDFCAWIDPQAEAYQVSHLRKVAEKLEQVKRGDILRLFITAPPRHWKSSITAEKFPLRCLAENPKMSIGCFSHGATLPIRFSKNIRNNIASNPKFQELYPDIRLKEDSANMSDWALRGAYRSSFRAFGVGSSPTGEGFDGIIIDDPVADAQEAYNITRLEFIWQWYQETLRDRLNAGGWIVLVMSRWHELDLAGRLLKEAAAGSGVPWEVLHLPALADTDNDVLGRKQGEALWPEQWPAELLMKTKMEIGGRAFAARFQGSPRAMEGNILDSTKLKMIDAEEAPKHFVKIVRRWDLAFSENQGADYVSGAKLGLSSDGKRYILHIKRLHGRWTSSAPIIRDVAEKDGPECVVAIEANGTQLGYYQEMHDDPRMANRMVIADKPEGKKEMRASMWGTRLDDGIIYCVRGEWNQEFFDQMDFFPNAENDDDIDAVSGAWKILGESSGTINTTSGIVVGANPNAGGMRTFTPRRL